MLPAAVRRGVLAAAAERLDPAGTFATLTYRTAWAPAVRRLRRDLAATFARVHATPTVWANLPPARLLIGRGPRPR